MYQALYRKYRPQTFDDVIGQEHITESLKNQIVHDRMSHAYIFIGSRGTGKTTCARILAKAVNCDHPVNGNPCGCCESCRAISEGSVMDIVELDAASNNGVDNVRALREEAVFSPANSKKRVYIIDEVHMLSTPAFNALLKILEEPPEHLIFVLATTELQKVPATILSRCQRHSFRRIDTDILSAYLLEIAGKEAIDLTTEAASLIASLSEGGARDALSMLDQCSGCGKIDVDQVYDRVGLAGNKRTIELLEYIAKCDAASALELFNSLWKNGKDPSGIVREVSSLCRDVIMTAVSKKGASSLVYGGYDKNELKRLSESIPINSLVSILDLLSGDFSKQNPKLAAELAIVKLCTGYSESEKKTVRPEFVKNNPPKYEAAEKIDKIPHTVATDCVPEFKHEPENVLPSVQESGDEWINILNAAKKQLRADIYMFLSDPQNAVGSVTENMLLISAVPGFQHDSLNKPDVVQIIEAAAESVTGKKLRMKLDEKNESVRSLSELKQFQEVKFV